VPVNIHRANVLWYNPDRSCRRTASRCRPPWMPMDRGHGEAWMQPGSCRWRWVSSGPPCTCSRLSCWPPSDPDKYNGLWNGAISWGDPAVLARPGGLQDCIRPSPIQTPLRLSWQDAAQLVVDGDAAFNVMGDWAEGFFRELGKEP
jgi:glucose/mannose transport system substrate-binding protein